MSARLFNNDAGRSISISMTPDKAVYRPGEPITFTVEADRDCYLALLYLSPSGKVVIIWPYQSDSLELKVRGNEAVRVPEIGGQFKFVPDGSAPYERILAVACTEKNVLLKQQDFLMSPATPMMSFGGQMDGFATSVFERIKHVPGHVRWGIAELNVPVNSFQTQPSVTTLDTEHGPEVIGEAGQEPSDADNSRKRTKTTHRSCR